MIDDQPSPFAASTDCVETPLRCAIALMVSPALTVYVTDAAAGAAATGARGRGRSRADEPQHLAGVDDRAPAEPVEREHVGGAQPEAGRRSR